MKSPNERHVLFNMIEHVFDFFFDGCVIISFVCEVIRHPFVRHAYRTVI